MSAATKLSWKDVRLEQLNPLISRKVVNTANTMVAQVFLTKGAVVPAHDHHNEQVTYIISGGLRFWLGEHAEFKYAPRLYRRHGLRVRC